MTSARIYALACISLALLAGCGGGEVAPAEHDGTRPTAAETASNQSVDAASTASKEIATTQGEVTFRTMQTSSLRASDAQATFADQAARHNREARQLASSASPEPAAPDRTAASGNAAAAAPSTPVAQDGKPAMQPVAPVDEKTILADPLGQWASNAAASSTYAQTTGEKAGYSSWQATGAPNVSRYSDNPAAWTTKSGDSKAPEWLEVKFAKAVYATSLRVRQSAAPGAISKLELIDADGGLHEMWSGTDATPYEKNTIGWLVKDFPKTSFLVTGARITLETARVWGWNEIDAVQLVGQP
jgi:hypothetical protein